MKRPALIISTRAKWVYHHAHALAAAANPDIKKHVYACNRAKTALQRLKKFTETFDSSKLAEAQLRLARMDDIYTDYEENSSALDVLTEGIVTEYEMDLQDDFVEFEDEFYRLKAWLTTRCVVPFDRIPDANPGATCGTLRLPSISVPEFSGDIEKWYSFYDTFGH